MNVGRRGFLGMLGAAVAGAAVAPKLSMATAEPWVAVGSYAEYTHVSDIAFESSIQETLVVYFSKAHILALKQSLEKIALKPQQLPARDGNPIKFYSFPLYKPEAAA